MNLLSDINMNRTYIRFDDINPSTDLDELCSIIDCISKSVTIILGIVPSNKDPFLSDRSEFSNNQIQILRNLQDLPNVLIFQHGYSHLPTC